MKKIIIPSVIALLLFMSGAANASLNNLYIRAKVAQSYAQRHPDTKMRAFSPGTPGASGNVLFGAPNISITGIGFEKNSKGWGGIGAIASGGSYVIGIGSYTTDAQGKQHINPWMNIGAGISGGAAATLSNGTILPSFQTYGTLGVAGWVQFIVGYDFGTHDPLVGIGATITVPEGAGVTPLKYF